MFFPLASTADSLLLLLLTPCPAFPWSGFLPLFILPLPSPIALGNTQGRFPALSTQLCLIIIPPHHEPLGCFKDPPVPLPRLVNCSGPHRGLNSKTKGECSVDRSMARNSLRSPCMHLCQVSNCPPGFRLSPPAIVPNNNRLDNGFLLRRPTAAAETSRHLPMVVPMLSLLVILKAFAYAGVASVAQRRRWKTKTRKRDWW